MVGGEPSRRLKDSIPCYHAHLRNPTCYHVGRLRNPISCYYERLRNPILCYYERNPYQVCYHRLGEYTPWSPNYPPPSGPSGHPQTLWRTPRLCSPAPHLSSSFPVDVASPNYPTHIVRRHPHPKRIRTCGNSVKIQSEIPC